MGFLNTSIARGLILVGSNLRSNGCRCMQMLTGLSLKVVEF